MLTEICLCHACSCQEILWTETAGQDEGAVTEPHEPVSFQAGTDVYLGAGPSASDFEGWLAHGQIPQARLDDAAYRTLMPRFLLGEFDESHTVPFWDTVRGCAVVGAPEHQQLAYEAAAQSLVLLKNKAGTLPLKEAPASLSGGKIALIGPMTNATWMYYLHGISMATEIILG
jgi:beta-glucosidase-like glycosyl hydrolase